MSQPLKICELRVQVCSEKRNAVKLISLHFIFNLFGHFKEVPLSSQLSD